MALAKRVTHYGPLYYNPTTTHHPLICNLWMHWAALVGLIPGNLHQELELYLDTNQFSIRFKHPLHFIFRHLITKIFEEKVIKHFHFITKNFHTFLSVPKTLHKSERRCRVRIMMLNASFKNILAISVYDYIVAVSFNDGGIQSTQRKSPFHWIVYT